MSVGQFNKVEMARWYAARHLKTAPGIRAVYYLPAGSPEREIRFVGINELMATRENDPLEPIDFGIDIQTADAHALLVLDVTPAQWEGIRTKQLQLPMDWSLDGEVVFSR
jgi:hypothetical protein